MKGMKMKKIKFSDLSWPKGLNLHLLREFISEDKLMKLIMAHVDDDRETREIILPSRKTAKKVFAHWLAKQHNWNWDAVMDDLRDGEIVWLRNLGLSREQLKRFAMQREREIEREKEGNLRRQ